MINILSVEKPSLYELTHFGILGMHWGVHKNHAEVGHSNLKRAKTANMDKWGKDAQHNILYVTGYSGSGKSTTARQLADNKTNVIHLDPYFEKMDKNVAASIQDKEFNLYLDKHFPEYKTIASPKRGEKLSKTWFTKVDTLMGHTEKFAAKQFHKNKKVIVEGVQLNDDTTYSDKKFFKDKPLVITGTNPTTSFFRASKRDGRSMIMSVASAKEYVKWYSITNKNLNTLSNYAGARRGEEWVTTYLSR